MTNDVLILSARCTQASSSITCHIKNGRYHAQFRRFRWVMSDIKVRRKSDYRKWLDEWFPLLLELAQSYDK